MLNKPSFHISLIILVGAAVLAPSLQIYFVSDNIEHIANAARNFRQLDFRYFRPISIASLYLDFQLWGDAAWGYHLSNALIHLANTILLYLLAATSLKSRFFALTAAFLFLLHPIHNQAIFWISGRTDMICALFYLSSLLFFVHYFKTEGRAYQVATGSCFLLALLSKEMAVTLPLAALAFVLIFEEEKRMVRLRESLRLTLPLWIILAGYLLFRLAMTGPGFLVNADHQAVAPLVILKNLAVYLGLMAIPAGHHQLAHFFQMHPMIFATAIIFTLLLVSLALGWMRKSRHLIFFALLTVISLIPVLRLVMRWYLYIPSAGFCLVLAFLLYKLNRSKSRIFVLSYGCALIIGWFYAVNLLQDQDRWLAAGHLAREYTEMVAEQIATHSFPSVLLLNVPGEAAETPVALYGLQSFINFRLQNEWQADTAVVKRITYLSLSNSEAFSKQTVRRIGKRRFEIFLDREDDHFIFPDQPHLKQAPLRAGLSIVSEKGFTGQIRRVNALGQATAMIIEVTDRFSPVLYYAGGRMEVVKPDTTSEALSLQPSNRVWLQRAR